MTQPAIFNRVFAKHVSNLKVLYFIFFLAFIAIPLQKAQAASFSCVNKDVTSSHAILTITETTDQFKLANVTFSLLQNNVNPNTLSDPDKISPGTNAKQQIYDFENVHSGGDYSIVARQTSNNSVEVITDCAFITPASTAASTASSVTTTPATTTTTTTPAPGQSTVTTPAYTPTATSKTAVAAPDNGMGLVPCDGDDCTINSVMQLLNKLMNFFFDTLLLPLFVVMVLYLGYSYLTAQGKPGMHAKFGSMAKHMVGGLVLMLCAWLIVKTILVILGYSDPFGFFG
jgi:hypothetical protein